MVSVEHRSSSIILYTLNSTLYTMNAEDIMGENYVNWGIIAPGSIANKAAEALSYLEKNGRPVRCYAVSSRNAERAEAFRAKWGFQKSYGNYDALFADDNVDVVYIASPHAFHAELALAALNAGKAVVCEKPACVNAKQLKEVCGLAASRSLFFMEAMWMAFNPCVGRVMDWLRGKRIGRLLEVNASFCFRNEYDPRSRLFCPGLAGGALLDVGIYPITFAMMAAMADGCTQHDETTGTDKCNVAAPVSIATAARIDRGVDLWNASTLMFANGMAATVKGAVDQELCDGMGNAYIYGAKGYIRIPLFWMGQEAELYTYNSESGEDATLTEKAALPFACNGYEYEMEKATNSILQGKTEAEGWRMRDSAAVCSVMDAMRAQWGLVYPFEKE